MATAAQPGRPTETLDARDRRPREDAPITMPAITLDGRTFRLATSYTFEADLYVFEHLTESGLLKAFSDLGTTPDLDEARARFVIRAYRSGHLFALLAGILVEDGVVWTPAIASANAAFFAGRSEPAEKQSLLEGLFLAVASFFLSAGPSFGTSHPMSSSEANHTASEAGGPASLTNEPRQVGPAAAPTTSASGPR